MCCVKPGFYTSQACNDTSLHRERQTPLCNSVIGNIGALYPSNTGQIWRNPNGSNGDVAGVVSPPQRNKIYRCRPYHSTGPCNLKSWIKNKLGKNKPTNLLPNFWLRSHSTHKIYKICMYDWAVQTQVISIAIHKHLSLYTTFFMTVYPGRTTSCSKFIPLGNAHICNLL